MNGIHTIKVPGGKLLTIEVDYDDYKVNKVEITGDFFLYPEEKLADIEKLLESLDTTLAKSQVESAIRDYANTNHILMVGLTLESIAEAFCIAKATTGAKGGNIE